MKYLFEIVVVLAISAVVVLILGAAGEVVQTWQRVFEGRL